MKVCKWKKIKDAAGRVVYANLGSEIVRVRAVSGKSVMILLYARNGATVWAARDIEAPGSREPGQVSIPILKALKTPGTSWWVGSNGVLERVATIYEERRVFIPTLADPPREGWRLVSAEEAVRLTAERRNGGEVLASEIDELAVIESHNRRLRRLKAQVELARLSVKRYERRSKLMTTLLGKWTSKLARREAALRKANGVKHD